MNRISPLYSVVVPVYEQWHIVATLLDALSAQTIERSRFEVILVDNGSAVVPPPDALPAWVRVIRCTTKGSYAARNAGAAEAKGDWLVFTDADCIPEETWLAELEAAIERHGPSRLVVGAVSVFQVSQNPSPSEIYDIVRGIPQDQYVGRGYGATANLTVARAVFEALGGFDPKRYSGGDAEFCRRAGRSGHSVVYAPSAVVAHPARTSWKELSTKVRRIKGGQMRPNSPWRHRSLIVTAIPPARGCWLLLRRAGAHPLKSRLTACCVVIALWTVEVREALRIKLGYEPERR